MILINYTLCKTFAKNKNSSTAIAVLEHWLIYSKTI